MLGVQARLLGLVAAQASRLEALFLAQLPSPQSLLVPLPPPPPPPRPPSRARLRAEHASEGIRPSSSSSRPGRSHGPEAEERPGWPRGDDEEQEVTDVVEAAEAVEAALQQGPSAGVMLGAAAAALLALCLYSRLRDWQRSRTYRRDTASLLEELSDLDDAERLPSCELPDARMDPSGAAPDRSV